MRFLGVLLCAASCAVGAACAAPPSEGCRTNGIALERCETKAMRRLMVEAPGFAGAIEARHSAYFQNQPPEVVWSTVAGAASHVLILQDPDAPGAKPYVHWLVFDLPGDARKWTPGAGVNGATSKSSAGGYFGPRPPGGKPHAYHLQVLALDRRLGLPAGAGLEKVLEAMDGHVIASGEATGTFEKPR
ncbi:MAG: YbhB/YbcL family Raf kinase inhibitor-like protein [Hyphomonadaceae bacterium]|nr:YbhB/YbcL family Raf kinase inhibitor-like protein [Hyphomonadaceae bacterium]